MWERGFTPFRRGRAPPPHNFCRAHTRTLLGADVVVVESDIRKELRICASPFSAAGRLTGHGPVSQATRQLSSSAQVLYSALPRNPKHTEVHDHQPTTEGPGEPISDGVMLRAFRPEAFRAYQRFLGCTRDPSGLKALRVTAPWSVRYSERRAPCATTVLSTNAKDTRATILLVE